VRRGAVAVAAALALGSVAACAPQVRRDGTADEVARAFDQRATAVSATAATALPPAQLSLVHAPTPLRGANGLACFDRHLVVAEALGDRLLRVSADGSLEPLALPSGLQGPDDLVFDDAGALFVTAAASGEVWRRGPEGSWSTVARGLRGVNAIARAPSGRLFVSTCVLGDGLYEVDPAGSAPPREIARDLGCPNAMVADDDGTLVVPLLTAGKVVRVAGADGSSTVLADGLRAPSAVKRAPDGSLVVLEAASGVIRALGGATPGPGAELAQLAPGLDGFAACGDSAVVSNFLTGAIVAIKPWPGAARQLEPPGLAVPRGLAQAGELLLVSDGVSIRRLRGQTAEILAATAIDAIPPPYALALAPDGAVWITVPHFGEVHRIDLAARTSEKVAGGLDWPTSIVATPHGGVFVTDSGAGRILEVLPEGGTRVVASGLAAPLGLALRGAQLLTVEPEGGRVLGFREGSPPTLVATGLAGPVGLAVDASGRLYVAETRTGYLIRVDSDGSRTRIAQGFDFRTSGKQPAPIALLAETGGGVLVALPRDGSIVRVTP